MTPVSNRASGLGCDDFEDGLWKLVPEGLLESEHGVDEANRGRSR
jgi:hypothetical protein